MRSAHVVCKQLGFAGGAAAYSEGARYGRSRGPIWLSNVQCRGNEKNIALCAHSYWGKTNCTHNQDIGITCRSGNLH